MPVFALPDGHPTGSTRYDYDAAERLRRLEIDGQERATYQYDPFGRRIAKTVNGRVTWFLYAPEGLIAELDAAGQPIRAYGWQPDAPFGTAPLWQAEIADASWQLHFLQADHLGTPQLATDPQGRITWQARAEAFGLTTPDPNSTITVNLRFPGQYYDAESGLHYNYFRDYDPQTGRYVQSDPIGLAGGINAYAYVGGNPIGSIDPSGEVGAAAGVAIAGIAGAIILPIIINTINKPIDASCDNCQYALIRPSIAYKGKVARHFDKLCKNEKDCTKLQEEIDKTIDKLRFFEDSCGNWGTVPHWYHQ